MAGFTNRGKAILLDSYFRNTRTSTGYRMALCTAAVVPNADTKTLSQLVEIAAGNGYTRCTENPTTGGYTVSRDAIGFDVLTEDDTADKAKIQLANVTWTASGGPIPASGAGASYAVLLDNQATPNIIAFWDIRDPGQTPRQVSSGQPLTVQDAELDLVEA